MLERGIVAVIVEEVPPAIYAVEHVIDQFPWRSATGTSYECAHNFMDSPEMVPDIFSLTSDMKWTLRNYFSQSFC